LIFLIRMDVGVEKVSGDFVPLFPQPLKRSDGAVGTTDVKKEFHLRQS